MVINARIYKKKVFRLTIGNACLHIILNINGIKWKYLVAKKDLGIKRKMFLHNDVHNGEFLCQDNLFNLLHNHEYFGYLFIRVYKKFILRI